MSLVGRAQETVTAVLTDGGCAVDATLGNGHDTLFLARRVGAGGHVFGFDVQQNALDATRERLAAAGMLERVTLFQHGHEMMGQLLRGCCCATVQAIMFNLGYLPGSDKRCITQAVTTISALEQALELLAPGGVITVLAYTGHVGGREETGAIKSWAQALSTEHWRVSIEIPDSVRANTPELITIVHL